MADWNTPPTFTSGDFLSAAEMNAYVRDNPTFLYAALVASRPVYLSGTQAAASAGSFATTYSSPTIATPDYDYACGAVVVLQLQGNSNSCAIGAQFGDSAGLFNDVDYTTSMEDIGGGRTLTMVGARDRNAGHAMSLNVQYFITAGSVNITTHLLTIINPR